MLELIDIINDFHEKESIPMEKYFTTSVNELFRDIKDTPTTNRGFLILSYSIPYRERQLRRLNGSLWFQPNASFSIGSAVTHSWWQQAMINETMHYVEPTVSAMRISDYDLLKRS